MDSFHKAADSGSPIHWPSSGTGGGPGGGIGGDGLVGLDGGGLGGGGGGGRGGGGGLGGDGLDGGGLGGGFRGGGGGGGAGGLGGGAGVTSIRSYTAHVLACGTKDWSPSKHMGIEPDPTVGFSPHAES